MQRFIGDTNTSNSGEKKKPEKDRKIDTLWREGGENQKETRIEKVGDKEIEN